MTKRYGVFVGTPKQAFPTQMVDMGFENAADVILVRDKITLAAAPAADVISLGVFGWESMLDPDKCIFAHDDLGASVTLAIGDITTPAALFAATSAHSATSNIAMLGAISNANAYKRLWEILGYATVAAAQAVGAQCELLMTIAGAAATGTVRWKIEGQRRI